MFNDKRILITGGTGSWGQTLTRLLLERYKPKEIIIFSRGELQQVLMGRKFTDTRVKYIIGDIRDFDSIEFATRGVDIIFHMAALKHVPICEDHPHEAIKTNIDGTNNVIRAAINNKVTRVIDVSTDKAVEPNNLYGMTKAVGEKLILQANTLSEHTRFTVIRGGNVMGSNGSIIPLFVEQIKSRTNITITDEKMTRFFLTLEEAILLLFEAAEVSQGGETFVMAMPACAIIDLVEVLMDYYGKVNTVITGIRPGEKLNEVLVSKHESVLTYSWNQDYFVILPSNNNTQLLEKYGHLQKIEHDEFSSATKLMSKQEIHEMLDLGGFLCK